MVLREIMGYDMENGIVVEPIYPSYYGADLSGKHYVTNDLLCEKTEVYELTSYDSEIMYGLGSFVSDEDIISDALETIRERHMDILLADEN